MRSHPVRAFMVVSLAVALTSVTGVSGARAAPAPPPDDVITVASFDFAESRLLAEIYSQALDRAGLPVQRAFGLGPRELVAPAPARGTRRRGPGVRGDRGAVPEHRPGTSRGGRHGHPCRPRPGARGNCRPCLAAAPAQDTNAFVVRREVAERLGLTRLSDLREVSRELTFGGPPECATRPLCLEGLRKIYGIEFEEVVALDAGGRLTHQALETGIIDVALLFSTDPGIGTDALVELIDDRALQPAENVTPIVRRAAADRFGRAWSRPSNSVSARLDTADVARAQRQGAGLRIRPFDSKPVARLRAAAMTVEDAPAPRRRAGSPDRPPLAAPAGAGARPVHPRPCRAASVRRAPSGSWRRSCCSSCRWSRCRPRPWRASSTRSTPPSSDSSPASVPSG